MSKHSLISTGLGLGLMAASMGASAQLHSFDGGMMYFGAAAGGNKYVAFVPQMARGAAGAAGVLMLEMFQPTSGTNSSWAYAIGGAVDAAAGGTGSGGSGSATITGQAANGLGYSGTYFFGDNAAISLAFSNEATISSQVCNVSFVASIGTQDQLFFTNVTAQPDDWNSASAAVSLTTATGGAGSTMSVAQALWNNASATILASVGASNASISGIATTVSGSAAVNSLLSARSKCVTAYTGRSGGTGTTIVGSPPGMIRLW